ncbi:MAG: DUF547 domain-containing protein [Mariniblastus sp.]
MSTFSRIVLFTCFFLTTNSAIPLNVQADEKAGKQWPANQRVSFNDIDHSAYNTLLQKHVDTDGMVNYKALHASSEDRQVLTQYLAQLGKADHSQTATKEAKLAYWINAYNALTIEGILRVYPTTSIRNHTAKFIGYNIWKNLKLATGGKEISLNDIEHEVLRKMNEPRIHFAIVCASIGCPRLLNEAYVAHRLEQQLVTNTRDFFSRSQNLRIDVNSKTLYLSSIMSWFGTDFGKTQVDQLKMISPYFPESAKKFSSAGGYRIAFSDYNWNLNTQSN